MRKLRCEMAVMTVFEATAPASKYNYLKSKSSTKLRDGPTDHANICHKRKFLSQALAHYELGSECGFGCSVKKPHWGW